MNAGEINLIDLLAVVLLHWRMIILCMLVGGVLGFVSGKGEATGVSLPGQYLSEQEIQNVNWVIAYEKAYREAEDYLEKSALMKIDPNQVGKAEATIAIEAADRQKSCDIEKVYEDIVQSGELMKRMAEDVGIEMIGIEEMIFIDKEKNNIMINGEDKNIFRIIAKHADEDQAERMLESTVTFLKEKQPDIESVLGEHKITVVNESFAVMADVKIAEAQKNILDNMSVMKGTLSAGKKSLSDKEQLYYAFLTDNEEAGQTGGGVTEKAAVSGVYVKYVLLGAGLAAFLYAFLVFLAYIFDTKIRATDSLQELYGIPQLGTIPDSTGKISRKPFGFIDRWILFLRDRDKRRFTPEEALELASTAVKISAGKEGLQEIFIIGCGLKDRPLELSEGIKAHLEKDGIQVRMLNNVLYDAQMMEELEYAKGVVLVEGIGVTLYSEIAKELELVRRQGITVLGGILLE